MKMILRRRVSWKTEKMSYQADQNWSTGFDSLWISALRYSISTIHKTQCMYFNYSFCFSLDTDGSYFNGSY